jgi:hypothetical protein
MPVYGDQIRSKKLHLLTLSPRALHGHLFLNTLLAIPCLKILICAPALVWQTGFFSSISGKPVDQFHTGRGLEEGKSTNKIRSKL